MSEHPYLQAWQERELRLQQIAKVLANPRSFAITPGMNYTEVLHKADAAAARLAETYGRLQNELLVPLVSQALTRLTVTGHIAMFVSDQGDISIIDDLADRCCCECGNHFDGAQEDDYCGDCWQKLYP